MPDGQYIKVSDVESYVSIDFTSDTNIKETEVGDYITQVEAEIDSILAACGITVPIAVDGANEATNNTEWITETRYKNLLKSYGVKAVVAAVIASGDIRPGLASTGSRDSRERSYLEEYYQNLEKLATGCVQLFPDAASVSGIKPSGLPLQSIEFSAGQPFIQAINNIRFDNRNIQIIGGRSTT